MKKSVLFGVLFGTVVAAAAAFFLKNSNDPVRYARYDMAFLPLSFDYPAEWKLIEDKGTIQKYQQVMLMGPRNTEKTFSAAFTIMVSPTRDKGGLFTGIEELKTHNLAHLFENPRVLEMSDKRIGGAVARDITAVFERPPFRKPGLLHKMVPVKERMVLFQKDGNLFEIRYSADQLEYPKYAKSFERLLVSIRLKSA